MRFILTLFPSSRFGIKEVKNYFQIGNCIILHKINNHLVMTIGNENLSSFDLTLIKYVPVAIFVLLK